MTATKKRILAGLGLVAATGIIVYLWQKHQANIMNDRKAQAVADHGYETAHDILFPNKTRRTRKPRHGQSS